MRNIATLFRILAIIGFLFLPKTFNYWKSAGSGHAIYEYAIANDVNFTEISDQEFENIKHLANKEGTRKAMLMLLGFNIPFLVCIFLSTYIATPIRIDDKPYFYLWPYCASVIIGLSVLPFGLLNQNRYIDEMSVSIVVACIYWVIAGVIPLAIAFISRSILIKKMKKCEPEH